MKAGRPWTIVLAVIIAIVSATPIQAEIRNFKFVLEGSQAVPPCATSGTGSATVTLDDVTGAVSVSGTFSGLGGNANNCHIHGPAAIGGTASPVVTLSFTPATSGTISGSGTLNAGQIADMIAGLHYVNLHSSFCGAGELRGQVIDANTTIPASSEWAMIFMGVGLLAAGVLVIRRRHVAALIG